MNKFVKGLFLIGLLFIVSCSKKPELILCAVLDPFYGKPIAGARVALVETKENSFGSLVECKTMAEFNTDEDGKVFYERIKYVIMENGATGFV